MPSTRAAETLIWEARVKSWLVGHDRPVKIKVSSAARAQLRQWFSLLDEDDGGTIDVEELSSLFQAIEVEVSDREIRALFREVKAEDELDFEQFVSLMTLRGENAWGGGRKKSGMPPGLMLMSYKRKHLVADLMDPECRREMMRRQEEEEAVQGGAGRSRAAAI